MHWYTGKKVYLEFNIIVALLKNEDIELSQKFKKLFDKNYVFPYSPAHMEEVAVIYQECKDKSQAKEYVNKHLNYISIISRNLEFLPELTGQINSRIELEHPVFCMNRVMRYYGITIDSEFREKFFMYRRTRVEFEQFCQENNIKGEDKNRVLTDDELQEMSNIKSSDVLSQIPPEKIFEQEEIRKISMIRLQTEGKLYKVLVGLSSLNDIPKYCNVKDNHPMKAEIVNFLIKTLHAAGYNPERKKKSRSFMHDTTHAIYAIGADFFVNDDFASRQKIKAVYSFLEVPCKILSKSEFIERDFA